MSGWYIMQRGWMDGFKPEPFTEREAFLWSIEQAAIKAHEQWFNGQPIAVQRGEFATSLRVMEKVFQWSVKRIRGFMERMRREQKWTQRQAHAGAQSPTVITVCNYEKYQARPDDQGTAKGTAKGTLGAQSGHSRGTQQNKGNKGKEEERPSVSSPEAGDGAAGPGPSTLPMQPKHDHLQAAFAAFEEMRHSIDPAARRAALSPDRRKKLAARLAEIGGLEVWAEVLRIVRASPFLCGETSRTGRQVATIDWLLKPESLRKVREGNYDERRSTVTARGSAVRSSPIDALSVAITASGLGG